MESTAIPVREFQSLIGMLRSTVEHMDEDDCLRRTRVVEANLDIALEWVKTDEEALELVNAVADACYRLAKPFAKGVLSPGQIAAGRLDILAAVDRFEQHLHRLPPSEKAVALAKLDAEWFPGRVANRIIPD
jgi:cob(I)alamin adenosyltransferase